MCKTNNQKLIRGQVLLQNLNIKIDFGVMFLMIIFLLGSIIFFI